MKNLEELVSKTSVDHLNHMNFHCFFFHLDYMVSFSCNMQNTIFFQCTLKMQRLEM